MVSALLGLLLVVTISSSAALGPAGAPAIAFTDNDQVVLAQQDGTELRRFPSLGVYSLDGNLFVGSHRPAGRSDELVGYDASSGTPSFRVPNAFAPVVLDGGRKTAFLPDRDGRRDRQVNSVWLRDNVTGRVRKIVQFSNGKGLPGISTGLRGEGVPLSLSFDRSGTTLAIAEGNDVDLFLYDVWLVDLRSRAVRRMTTGLKSRWPAVSPDGRRLAVVRERARCSGGLRAGDLEVMNTRGPKRRTIVVRGSCSRSYSVRGWATSRRLVAFRLMRRPSGPRPYRVDLVSIDPATRDVRTLVATGDVAFVSVSSSRRLLAYTREGQAGFYVRDLTTGETTRFARGREPRLTAEHRW